MPDLWLSAAGNLPAAPRRATGADAQVARDQVIATMSVVRFERTAPRVEAAQGRLSAAPYMGRRELRRERDREQLRELGVLRADRAAAR